MSPSVLSAAQTPALEESCGTEGAAEEKGLEGGGPGEDGRQAEGQGLPLSHKQAASTQPRPGFLSQVWLGRDREVGWGGLHPAWSRAERSTGPRPQIPALQRGARGLHQQPLPGHIPASFGGWQSCLGGWTLPWTLMSSQDCCHPHSSRQGPRERSSLRGAASAGCPLGELEGAGQGHVSLRKGREWAHRAEPGPRPAQIGPAGRQLQTQGAAGAYPEASAGRQGAEDQGRPHPQPQRPTVPGSSREASPLPARLERPARLESAGFSRWFFGPWPSPEPGVGFSLPRPPRSSLSQRLPASWRRALHPAERSPEHIYFHRCNELGSGT